MKLGEKIKSVRKKLGLSVQEVYLKCVDIYGPLDAPSYKTLLRIEKGKQIRASSLIKISHALNMPIKEFIDYPKIDKENIVTRKDKSLFKFKINEKARFSILNCLSMEYSVAEVIIDPEGKTFDKSPDDGKRYQKTIIVNRGHITISIGNEKYRLKSGDAISFHSTNVHTIQNEGKSKCKLYVIQHPLPLPRPNEEISTSDILFLYDKESKIAD